MGLRALDLFAQDGIGVMLRPGNGMPEGPVGAYPAGRLESGANVRDH